MTIPPSAWPFFQEYDPAKLDVQQHAALIIERILANGSRAEVRWLLTTYGRVVVRAWVEEMGASRLSARRYRLWCLVLKLPEQEKKKGAWPY
jgi:hypothetical protein